MVIRFLVKIVSPPTVKITEVRSGVKYKADRQDTADSGQKREA